MKILVENTRILTMDSEEPEIIQGSIGTEADRISFIGDIPKGYTADEVIDGRGRLVMPGLVNSHTHIAMSILRHTADDLPFWNWLNERIIPAEELFTPDDVYNGSMLSIAEMIRSGVTTFADMYFHMDNVAEAVSRTGMRANLSRGMALLSDADLYKLEEAEAFFHRWNNTSGGRIRVDLGPHAPYSCGPEYLEKTAEKAVELGAGIHIHISESWREVEDIYSVYKKSPVEYVRDCGIFSARTCAAHCVKTSEDDLAILLENSVSVMNNPGSNLKFGNGFAPVSKMLSMGMNVSLGTDGAASNNNLNMFEEMNLAALVNKAAEHSPVAVPAFEALKMATVNGAKTLGISGVTGSLRPGKKADLIIIDLEKPHFYPMVNPVPALVYSAQASDVCTVICDGQFLMKDRILLTIDETEVCRKAQETSQRLSVAMK